MLPILERLFRSRLPTGSFIVRRNFITLKIIINLTLRTCDGPSYGRYLIYLKKSIRVFSCSAMALKDSF